MKFIPRVFGLRTLVFGLGLLPGLALSLAVPCAEALAAVDQWQKGATILSFSPNDFASEGYQTTVRNLKAKGVNTVNLLITYVQPGVFSGEIGPAGNTPTDEALIAGVNYAHSQGLRVSFQLHVNSGPTWRAFIDPPEPARTRWFQNYGAILNRYAVIAQANGVEQFSIGSETISMAADDEHLQNTSRWISMIRAVRALYGGKLTYSANWGESPFANEVDSIAFWNELDFIGISAYYRLSGYNGTPESVFGMWRFWEDRNIKPIQEHYQKPVVFTEVGYRNVAGIHQVPWNGSLQGAPNEKEQADLYEALMAYWNQRPYMVGAYWWYWETNPNAGGPADLSYLAQNKQAETVMARWFSGTPAPTSPSPQPDGVPNFSSGFGGPAAGFSAGQSARIAAVMTNSGERISSTIVDLEIYDAGGTRVLQRFFEGQTFLANETRTFEIDWTPPADGAFILKAGVFDPAWLRQFHWNDAVSRLSVGFSTPPPPAPQPPSPAPEQTVSAVDIWWPTDGANINGIQPFKAMVPNADVSQYRMFWQVDGDRLNPMPDSPVDWPHKEALVDLSSWTWKGGGPYTLTFTAQRLSGELLISRSIDIFIPR